MDIYSKATFLSEFQPRNLAKHLQNKDWLFAEYNESSEQRKDGKYYRAFVFRNKERTVFGLKEFYEDRQTDFRQLAARVVSDEKLRSEMISDDEDLRKIWKRH